MTERDLRKSGREIFLAKGVNSLEFDINKSEDDEEEIVEEADILAFEEEKYQEEHNGALYDKDLFA